MQQACGIICRNARTELFILAKFRKILKHVKEYEAEVWTLHAFERESIEYPDMHVLFSEYLLGRMQAKSFPKHLARPKRGD